MSNTIDQRVVEMRFDNKHFESNVQTSMKTIDNLKQGLNFTGAAKGLDGVNSAVRGVNMTGLSDAVESVRLKFSALEVMAVTALANITNSVVNAGKKIISSLTIDPITKGFQEYETQMNSVQTILANTQSRQKLITKETTGDIKDTTKAAVEAAREANSDVLDDLRDTNKQKLKEYNKAADAEVDVIEDKYEKESEALSDAMESERDLLRSSHDDKLKLYNEEYMAKLKATDEDRYNKIKAIDDQIARINKRTAAEEKALKRERQQERISELRDKINTAKDLDDRMDAQKRLSDYEDEIAREKLLEQREAKIDKLELGKDAIEEEYDVAREKIAQEYAEKKTQENELYDIAAEALREKQAAEEKAFRETFKVERELLREKQDLEKEALLEKQQDEIDSLNKIHKVALDNIEKRQAASAAASGPQEFETTKGSTLQDVNRALDELNEYADKTIYNFTEMTRNIGTFTAAGVELDTSVQAIKGIANLAAVSGSNAQQASTAMYQLSQALQNGKVNLQDWNSVTNAGMGGQIFKDSLVETARVHGVAIDDIIAKSGSFRSSLESGWLSAEILTETFSKFTGDLSAAQLKEKGYTEEQIVEIIKLGEMANDAAQKVKTFTQLQDTLKEAAQSGWTKSWQIILGDFHEARNLFTEISDIVGKILGDSAEARNAFLGGGLSSGWKQFLEQGVADETGLKEAIINTAKETTPEIEEMIKQAGSFEESLKSGWLTADILSTSLENLTAKTRNLSDEELERLGYSRAQITSLEKLNDEIQNGTISMEEFTDKMTQASGRENLIDALLSSFRGIVNIAKMVKDSFKEIFPPATAEQLYKITEKIKELGASFEAFTSNISSNGIETPFSNLKRTFKGLFAAVDVVFQLFKSLFKFISPATSSIGDLAEAILHITAGWGDWLVALDESIKKGDKFTKAFEKIADFLKPVTDKLNAGRIAIVDWFMSFEKIDTSGFETFFTISQNKLDAFAKIGEIFSKIWEGIKTVAKKISDTVGPIFGAFWEDMKTALGGTTLDDIINGLIGILSGGLIVSVTKMINALKGVFKKAGKFMEGINDILEGVKGVLKAYQNEINARALIKIAIAVALLVGSIIALTLVDPEKLLNATIAISTMFAELVGATSILDKLGGNKGLKGLGSGTAAMVAMAGAVLILSFAIKNVADLDEKKLENGFTAIGGLVAGLVTAMIILSKNAGAAKISSTGFLAVAIAVLMLSKVVAAFSEMDPGKLWMGIGALSAIVVELVTFMLLINKTDMNFKKGAGFIALANAIKTLSKIVITLSEIDPMKLLLGLGALGFMLLELSAFTVLIDKTTGLEKQAVGFLVIAASLAIMSKVVEKLGAMDPMEMLQGIGGLGAAMLILAAGLYLMKDTAKGSAAVILAAIAIAILAPALMLLGSMSWPAIAKGLVALAGSLTILGVAGLLLKGMEITILAVAGSIALIGLGFLGMGVGLMFAGAGLASIAIGITALAAAGVAGAAGFIAAMKVLLEGLLVMMPLIGEVIKAAIIAWCDVIISTAPNLFEAFKVIMLTWIDVLVFLAPAMIDGVLRLIIGVLEALVTHGPKIIGLLFDFIIGVLKGLAEKVPDLIKALFDVFKAIFEGVMEALKGMSTEDLTMALSGVGIMAALVIALAAIVPFLPAALVGVLGVGGIIAELALVLAAVGQLTKIPGLMDAIGDGGAVLQAIGTALGMFIGGLAGGIMVGVSSQLPQIGTDLSKFMTNAQPFIFGAGKITKETMAGVKALAEVIVVLTAANVMNGLTAWFTGGTSLASFGEELAEFGPHFKTYYDAISEVKGPVVVASANAAKALSEMVGNLPTKGGLASLIKGDSSIVAFGEALVEFGPNLMDYAISVEDLDPDVVVNSTNAAKALSGMADNLPKKGGLAGLFSGENSLTVFAAGLSTLGPSLMAYSLSVTDLDEDVVTNSVNAASALAAFATAIPNAGGLVSLFTGDNNIATFGENLSAFGTSFKAYYEEVSAIKISQLRNIIDETANLVTIAQDMAAIKTSGMTKFGESLKKLAETGIQGFIDTFTTHYVNIRDAAMGMIDEFTGKVADEKEKVVDAFKKVVKAVTDSLVSSEQKGKFKSSAETLLDSFTSATKEDKHAKGTTPESGFLEVIGRVNSAIKSRSKDFYNSGILLMNSLVNGANSKELTNPKTKEDNMSLGTAFQQIIVNALNAINNGKIENQTLRDMFKTSGLWLIEGFIEGVRSKNLDVGKSAATVGLIAAEAVRIALGEESPSKVFYCIGEYAVKGFTNALDESTRNTYTSGYDMAESAKKGLSQAIAKMSGIIISDIDTQPTIRPVMDLTEIQNGTNQLYRMMQGVDGYAVSGSVGLANKTANSMSGSLGRPIDTRDATIDFLKKAVKELTEKPPQVFENTFHITGDNPDQIAEKVSEIIQHQVERRDAAWA